MHISDQELLLALDGELPSQDAARVNAHLAECWTCRARRQEMENAIADFVRVPKPALPPVDGPRALLKAQIAQLNVHRDAAWQNRWVAAGVGALLIAAGLMIGQFWIVTHDGGDGSRSETHAGGDGAAEPSGSLQCVQRKKQDGAGGSTEKSVRGLRNFEGRAT